jgi:hypothetical protein
MFAYVICDLPFASSGITPNKEPTLCPALPVLVLHPPSLEMCPCTLWWVRRLLPDQTLTDEAIDQWTSDRLSYDSGQLTDGRPLCIVGLILSGHLSI